MPESAPLLEATGIQRTFGAARVLRGVALSAGTGSLQVILGPNGAGKTTLLRILAGLTRPTSGQVLVLGHSLRNTPRLRREIGLLSHQSLLYDDLTPRENLTFIARLYGLKAPDQSAMAALDAVGLAQRSADPVRRLSRGMVQRVAIARALLHRPRILLLDEPFTGLDPRAADRLVRLLEEQLAAGTAVVVVAHSLYDIWPVATRISVLVRGQWVIDEPRPTDRDRFMVRVQEAFSD
ncbi:MAG TPA: heme ABC exporter ATP-binding protein CcmA [Gemmatimonadales bacterium]